MRRLDPAYRACFADGSTIHVRSGREAMRDEIERTCGSVDAAAFDGFVDWLRRLYVVEMPHFIDANYDSPLGLLRSPRAVAELVRLGAFGRLGDAVRRRFRDPRLHRLFSFQAMYAGLAPDAALALYAVITYMDSINGVYFPEGGMHAVPVALAQAAEKAGATLPLRRRGDRDPALPGRPGGRRAHRGRRADPGRRGGLHRRPAGRVPDLPVRPQAAAGRPVGVLLPLRGGLARRRTRGAGTADRPPQHPLRRPSGASAFDDLLKRGPADARPVPAGHRALAGRADRGAGRVLDALRAGAGAQPERHGRLAHGGRPDAGPAARASWPSTGYPDDVVVEELVTPLDWEAPGHGRGHPVRAGPHLRRRPARSGRATWSGGGRGCSSPAPAPCRASAYPWC